MATYSSSVREKSSEGVVRGGHEVIWLLLLDVTAGLALQARAADDRDVAPHLL